MNIEKVQQILQTYREMVENTREALRLAGMTEAQIVNETINFPDFNKMIMEDIVKFLNDVRKLIILHLFNMGLNSGEIAHRIGQYHLVWKTLKEEGKDVGEEPPKDSRKRKPEDRSKARKK